MQAQVVEKDKAFRAQAFTLKQANMRLQQVQQQQHEAEQAHHREAALLEEELAHWRTEDAGIAALGHAHTCHTWTPAQDHKWHAAYLGGPHHSVHARTCKRAAEISGNTRSGQLTVHCTFTSSLLAVASFCAPCLHCSAGLTSLLAIHIWTP